MSDFFEAYGWLAEHAADATVVAGRHAFQGSEEVRVVEDVRAKLDLAPEHRLLEIGWGLGNPSPRSRPTWPKQQASTTRR